MDAKSKSLRFSASRRKDALTLAQGLFESKVLVERPPTSSQKSTYNTVRGYSGSAKQRISGTTRTGHTKNKRASPNIQLVNPAWRPFTGGKSLSSATRNFASQTDHNEDGGLGVAQPGERPSKDEDVNITDGQPRLPKSAKILESWINEDSLEEWTGIPSDPNCFVILPCGCDYTLDFLPPLQTCDEPLLQRPVHEAKKYIAPKILHNYNYLENGNDYQCQHDRKIHPKLNQSITPRLRTSEIIREEIEDLERLLQGYGNPNSSSIVNRYQYEITTLKQMVLDTLRDYNIITATGVNAQPTKNNDTTDVIQGDLFEFLSRHEEVIAAIKEKRDTCIKELARLEKELAEGR